MSLIVETGSGRIKTTIATDRKQVDEGIRALMSSTDCKRLIGLGTIASRTLSRNISIDVLQLCDRSQVKLSSFYRLPESLYNFLSLPGFTFVGFGIKDAMASLREQYGVVCKNALEAGPSKWPSSLCSKASSVLRTIHIPSTDCISDIWDAKVNFTEDSVMLAVKNAHAAFRIGNNIL